MSYRVIVRTFDPETGETIHAELYQTFATEPEADEHGRKSLAEIQQTYVDLGYSFITQYCTREVAPGEILPFARL